MKRFLTSILALCIFSLSNNLIAQNCTVNAGTGKSQCTGSVIQLNGGINGSITDPGTISWSIIQSPDPSFAINNPYSLSTTTSIANVPGTYTFRLQATCSIGGTTFQDVTYTIKPTPSVSPQILSTSPSPLNCYVIGTPITFTGTAPTSTQNGFWTFTTPGKAPVYVNAGTSASATFTPTFPPDECGASTSVTANYNISENGCGVTVTNVYNITRKYAPVTATPDPPYVCDSSGGLRNSCPGAGTGTWTCISQPAGAPNPVIKQTSNILATASKMVNGTYVYRYTVTDATGCNSGFADATVVCNIGDKVTSAINDSIIYVCTMPTSVTLYGNQPAVGETSQWANYSGGTATIANPNSPVTIVTGMDPNQPIYEFTYTISKPGSCSSSGYIEYVKRPTPTLTHLGPVTYCTNTTAPLAGEYVDSLGVFGSYGYKTLDSITATITYVSGPAPLVNGMGIDTYNQAGAPTSFTTGKNIPAGTTFTKTFSGLNLYNDNGAQGLYQLSARIGFSGAGVPGKYTFHITYSTPCGTQSGDIVINYGQASTVYVPNAGSDQILVCGATSTSLTGNMRDYAAVWQTISMPPGATINPINSSNNYLNKPTITGLVDGKYQFQLLANPGPACAPTQPPGKVQVLVSSTPPPQPDAGLDVTICAGAYQLSGSPVPYNAFASWTQISPASPKAVISDTTIANPNLSGLSANTAYTFVYTFKNGCGSKSDTVVVTTSSSVGPTRPALSINNGTNHCVIELNYPTTNKVFFYINTTAGDDTTVRISTLDPNTKITTVLKPNGSQSTITVNSMTADYDMIQVIVAASRPGCSGNTASDTLYIPVANKNAGATNKAVAGPAQSFCSLQDSQFPFTATLTGNNLAFGRWKLTNSSNGQSAIIANDRDSITTVTISSPGIYQFAWYYDPGVPNYPGNCNTSLANTEIIVGKAPSVAFAGNNITFCNATGITNLNASPVANGTGQWTVVNVIGGLAPTIANPSSPASQITFSGTGQAVLQWSAFGAIPECGQASSSNITVTYVPAAKTGPDQTWCGVNATTLSAVNPAPTSGLWTVQSGPAGVVFTDSSLYNTTVSGLIPGNTYKFLFTVAQGTSCESSSSTNVTIGDGSTQADAGAAPPSCSGGTNSIQLAATAPPAGYTGTWKIEKSPSATVGSFNNINLPNASYNGVTVAGEYVFSWTITNGICSSTQYLTYNAVSGTPCVLPVILNGFSASISAQCEVTLNWRSTEEMNFKYFIVQRSYDGVTFNDIARIDAKGSNSAYQYNDKNGLAPTLYYRLKMVDIDGSSKMSGVISMRLSCYDGKVFRISPNPVTVGKTATATIELTNQNGNNSSQVMLLLRNITGAIVNQQTIQLNTGTNTVTLGTSTLIPGVYLAELHEHDGRLIANAKVVVVK